MQIAQPIAVHEKKTAEMSIVIFLPNPSLKIPATATPMIEPIRAQPTYHPCCIVLRENCLATSDTVPEITAVS